MSNLNITNIANSSGQPHMSEQGKKALELRKERNKKRYPSLDNAIKHCRSKAVEWNSTTTSKAA